LVKILVEIKKTIPPWVRIMRIQREVESNDVVSGPKVGNLRQLVSFELEKQGIKCKCIRCREIGLKNIQTEFSKDDLMLCRSEYFSSGGKEMFLSFETKDNSIIFGFLRLRLMPNPQRKELTGVEENGGLDEGKISSGIVRELHVYGTLARIGEKTTEDNSLEKNNDNNDLRNRKGYTYQHKGLGQKLLHEAEKICKQEYNLKKLSVISAIGTREYYKKFGYIINGPYVTKLL
jgi:elongator complex protein 3